MILRAASAAYLIASWATCGLVAWLVRPIIARRRRQNPPRHGSAILIPPASPGSFGDEALLSGAIEGIAELHGTGAPVAVATLKDAAEADDWTLPGEPTFIDLSAWLTSARGGPTARALRQATRSYERLLYMGTDTLDGFYGLGRWPPRLHRLLRLADRLGFRVEIVGVSFSASPTPEAVKELSALPSSIDVVARDPRSAERLAPVVPGALRRSNDTGFLLRAKPTKAVDELVAAARHTSGDLPLVALNLNRVLAKEAGTTLDWLLDAGEALIRSLSGQVAWVLVPHDRRRGDASDVALARRLAERVADEQVTLADTLRSAAEIKYLCQHLDLVVTGRMHLSIAALGVGTPALCIEFQGKVAGLYSELGVPDLCWSLDRLDDTPALRDAVLGAIAHGAQHRTALQRSLPEVRERALSALA